MIAAATSWSVLESTVQAKDLHIVAVAAKIPGLLLAAVKKSFPAQENQLHIKALTCSL